MFLKKKTIVLLVCSLLSYSSALQAMDLDERDNPQTHIKPVQASTEAEDEQQASPSLPTANNVLIDDAGAQMLARGNLRDLTWLDLRQSYISDDGARALARAGLASLTRLDLNNPELP